MLGLGDRHRTHLDPALRSRIGNIQLPSCQNVWCQELPQPKTTWIEENWRNTSSWPSWKMTRFWLELLTCRVGGCWEFLRHLDALAPPPKMRDTSTELSMMIGYVLMLDLQWSTMIYNDLQWSTMIYNDLQWSTMIYNDLQWSTICHFLPRCHCHSQTLRPESSRFHGGQFCLRQSQHGFLWISTQSAHVCTQSVLNLQMATGPHWAAYLVMVWSTSIGQATLPKSFQFCLELSLNGRSLGTATCHRKSSGSFQDLCVA